MDCDENDVSRSGRDCCIICQNVVENATTRASIGASYTLLVKAGSADRSRACDLLRLQKHIREPAEIFREDLRVDVEHGNQNISGGFPLDPRSRASPAPAHDSFDPLPGISPARSFRMDRHEKLAECVLEFRFDPIPRFPRRHACSFFKRENDDHFVFRIMGGSQAHKTFPDDLVRLVIHRQDDKHPRDDGYPANPASEKLKIPCFRLPLPTTFHNFFASQSTFIFFFISVNVARRWNERKTVLRSQ
jgi:hypothetical protein